MSTQSAETKTPLSKKSKMYYIHSIIGTAIMFLFGFLPAFDPVTPLGMKFLGIFIGLIYLWSTVDMGWPIFMSFAALIVLDCMPATDIYVSAFSNSIVLMCLFTMLVLMPLAETGIFNYVAVWLLKKPFLKGHPWRLSIGLILLVFLGCVFQGGLAILFMVYELTYKICDMCKIERSHAWAGAIVMGATLSFIIGGAVFPFTGTPLFFLGIFTSIEAFQWPFAQYILFMVLMEIVVVFFYLVFMKLLRIDLTPLKNVDVSGYVKTLAPINDYQKKSAAMLIIFILCLIVAGIAPNLPANPVTNIFTKLGLVGISWIFMCIMIIWRLKDKPAFTLNTMAAKIPWDSVLIICIGMSFGPAITGEGTGINELLYQLTAPLLSGASPFVFCLLISLVTLVLTNFFNNTVVAMLMVSIIAAYTSTLEINVISMAAMLIFSSQLALLVPGASYYAGLAHGQAVHVGRKNGFKWGAVAMISAAISLPIMLTVGNILF